MDDGWGGDSACVKGVCAKGVRACVCVCVCVCVRVCASVYVRLSV